jgi:hypothetical protein
VTGRQRGVKLTRLAVAGALGASMLAACSGDDARERTEVLRRIDALRDAAGASVADRRQLLEALRGARASQSTVAEARDRCVTAYADLIDANEIEESARKLMATGERVDTLALAAQLDRATKLLEQSREGMPACDQAATRLRATKE